MIDWLARILALLIALTPLPGRAGPILDIGLQFLGITTHIEGDPAGNYVDFTATAGTLSKTFTGTAQSSIAVPALVLGFGNYDSRTLASSVSWDARFRVNQPGIRIQIDLGFADWVRAGSSGWAKAAGDSYVNLGVNGVSTLSDHQRTTCNTFIFDCENGAAYANSAVITLDHLVVGQVIDIFGSLSVVGSAEAGPACGSPSDIRYCLGVGMGNSFASFSITAIPEPSSLALFGLGLAGLAAVRRRRKQ